MPRSNPASPASPAPPSPAVIGFRLDDASREVLGERAAALGVSPHELARRYLIEVLHEPEERAALREALVVLHKEITGIREDIPLAVEALLTSAGKVTAADARAYVEEHFP